MPLSLSAASLEPMVREAGRIAMGYFGSVTPERKDDRSLVSEADRAVERYLVDALRGRFPEDGIVGEELGTSGDEAATRIWAIDPIDGTTGFLAGLPTWSVCVGLCVDGVPVLGLVYLPVTGEMFTADPTTGARLNGEPLRVRSEGTPDGESALLGFSTVHQQLVSTWPGRIWSLSSAAVTIVYITRGVIYGGVVDPVCSYDIAGAMAVLHGAGGTLCYLGSGEPVDLSAFLLDGVAPDMMVASDPDLQGLVRGHFRRQEV